MVQRSVKLRSSRKEKYSIGWKVAIIAALVLFSVWEIVPTVRYFSSKSTWSTMDPGILEKLKNKALNLGLDLQGGIHLVMEVDTAGLAEKDIPDAVDKVMTVITNRVDQFGLTEPVVQKQGEKRIIIELPGMSDVERAKNLIGKTARLEFKLLKSDEDIKFITDKLDLYLSGAHDSTAVADTTKTGLFEEGKQPGTETKKFTSLFKYQQIGGIPSFNILVDMDNVPRVEAYLKDPEVQKILEKNGVMLLWGPENERQDDMRALYVVNAANEMTGEMVADARVVMGGGLQAGQPQIQMESTSEGAGEWARITGNNVGKRIGIVLDNTLFSSPVVREKIYGGTSSISGSFTNEEARDLAIVLRAGSLPASVNVIEDRTVGPSLGADSIRQSRIALLIGFGSVVVFMIVYYYFAGVVAVFALILNMLFIIAYLAYFRATLTLPGIAGIILTIGMAVDANVLVYERIREELRLGNTARVAINNGFLRARWTILDSNITTFLTGIILYNFGTGPIKGFALTLMVGIVASVFTCLFITKVIYDILSHKFNFSGKTFGVFALFSKPSFPFVSFRKKAYIVSGVVILAGIISLFAHGGPQYSIDFLGGSLLELHFDKPVTVAAIRDALGTVDVKGTDLSTSEIKFLGDQKEDVLIRIVKVGDMHETSEKVKESLRTSLKDSLPSNMQDWILREEMVGPSIGSELKGQALWAIFFSLIMLVIYMSIRFEFKYSIGAILSLIHDVLVTIGLFSLLGKEISLTIVAAILTIIGYSLNDTIVVYDRIREKLRKGVQEGYFATIDNAINETLSRTVITAFTTLLTVLALFMFGGAVIHDFSFAMLVGIVTGTYSSIYVAAPLLCEWYLHVTQKKKAVK
ncbi:protein translocase subunit SecD [bacterium]|nr:protein translocase subunit SecD [bacterium]